MKYLKKTCIYFIWATQSKNDPLGENFKNLFFPEIRSGARKLQLSGEQIGFLMHIRQRKVIIHTYGYLKHGDVLSTLYICFVTKAD